MNLFVKTKSLPHVDADAFAQLIENHSESVYRYLRARLGPEIAEDATAAVFEQAWKIRVQFDAQDSREQKGLSQLKPL